MKMIPNIRLLVSILLSTCFIHASTLSKKRKGHPVSHEITAEEGHTRVEDGAMLHDPLGHQAKRQTMESVKHPLPSFDSNMGTVTSESSSTPLTSSMQQTPRLNGKVSVSRSSRKKGSALLHDLTNTVDPVQVESAPVMAPNILQQQQQVILQPEEITQMPIKLLLPGCRLGRSYYLPELSAGMAEKCLTLEPRYDIIGGHPIRFHFIRTFDTFSVRLSLSSYTKGQIKVQLMGLERLYDESRLRYTPLDTADGMLNDGEVLPLGKLKDIQRIVRNDPYIHMVTAVCIEPWHLDGIMRSDFLEQSTLEKTQQTSERIKQLLKEKRYNEIEKLGDEIPKDTFVKCLAPQITELDEYKHLCEYLRKNDMLTSFFLHGNLDVIRDIIYDDYEEYEPYQGDSSVAVISLFEGGHCERSVELLEIMWKLLREEDTIYDLTSFSEWVFHFFDNINPEKDNTSLKHFFASREKFKQTRPGAFEAFCEGLIYYLRWAHAWSIRQKLFDDLIGQPSLLTPTSFCCGILYEEESDESDDCIDDMLFNFVECGWAEAIQVGLQGKYRYGGERLWKVMTKRFPDKCSGELPQDNDLLLAVCNKFTSKQQREERWAERNAPAYLVRLGYLIPILDILPKVLWTIIIEYAITWLDVE